MHYQIRWCTRTTWLDNALPSSLHPALSLACTHTLMHNLTTLRFPLTPPAAPPFLPLIITSDVVSGIVFFKVKLQVQLPVPSSTVTVHFQKCKICRKKGDDDRLLLCDDCNQAFHMYCLRPQLIHVPRGDWFCAACVVSYFIPAHLSLSCLFCCIRVLRFGTLYYTWIEMEAQAGWFLVVVFFFGRSVPDEKHSKIKWK